MTLQAPFPWWGGKSRVAAVVWERFGDVPNYVEPFFGSGAVLLQRPGEPGIETVNDKDGFIANFWRAVQHDPEQTAHWADWPVNENDLHARHIWLVNQRDTFMARLEADPDYYDAKIAGWWAWGICCWIGSGWCSGEGPWRVVDGHLVNTARDLGNNGRGVNRQLVHLGGNGQGVNRKRGRLGGYAETGLNARSDLQEWFAALSDRLRRVRVCCGDWTRVMGPTPTFKHGMTGVFLDPPYSHDERQDDLYRVEEDVADDVRRWAVENGANPLLRIALCGYEGEHDMPDGWTVHEWKAAGGYGSQGDGETRGAKNATRERIWFSPAYLPPAQGRLL